MRKPVSLGNGDGLARELHAKGNKRLFFISKLLQSSAEFPCRGYQRVRVPSGTRTRRYIPKHKYFKIMQKFVSPRESNLHLLRLKVLKINILFPLVLLLSPC